MNIVRLLLLALLLTSAANAVEIQNKGKLDQTRGKAGDIRQADPRPVQSPRTTASERANQLRSAEGARERPCSAAQQTAVSVVPVHRVRNEEKRHHASPVKAIYYRHALWGIRINAAMLIAGDQLPISLRTTCCKGYQGPTQALSAGFMDDVACPSWCVAKTLYSTGAKTWGATTW